MAQYFDESQKKIKNWQYMLDSGKKGNLKSLSKKEMERISNRLSALRARVDKKNEYVTLQKQSLQLQSQFRILLDILDSKMSSGTKAKIKEKIKREMPKKMPLTYKYFDIDKL